MIYEKTKCLFLNVLIISFSNSKSIHNSLANSICWSDVCGSIASVTASAHVEQAVCNEHGMLEDAGKLSN